MKTPKSFNDLLKKRIISMEMLDAALYSVNKRAKNHRDKAQEYYDFYHEYGIYDKFHNASRESEKKKEYYKKKDILLSILEPIEIHKTLIFDELYNQNKYVYYAFYKIANGHSYHSPITKAEANNLMKNRNLDVKTLDALFNDGHKIEDLISVQFINKLIELIESGDFKLIP